MPTPSAGQREKESCFPHRSGEGGLGKLVFHSIREDDRLRGGAHPGEGSPSEPCPSQGPTPSALDPAPPIHSTNSFSINVLKMKILIKKIKTKKIKIKTKPARISGGLVRRICTGDLPHPGHPPLSPSEAVGSSPTGERWLEFGGQEARSRRLLVMKTWQGALGLRPRSSHGSMPGP